MVLIKITMHSFIEKQKELMQTLLSMIESTSREKGCLRYDVSQNIENLTIFQLISEWETHKDLDHYILSQPFGILLGAKSLLQTQMVVKVYTTSKVEGMERVSGLRSKDAQIAPRKN